jgi:hypothetical protein
MSLPYEGATSGKNAIAEIQKILQRFGCQSFGCMDDFENKKVIVQFKYKDTPITVEASMSGYAVAWLKEHPWSHRMRRSKAQHEQEALRIAGVAVYSILRDWIKGQVTAIECGILSFEAAFLANVILPSGRTIMQHVTENKLLLTGPSQAASTH